MTIWTAERTAQLRDYWSRGMKPGAIARAMDTTRAAVIGRSRVLNLHFHSGKVMVMPPHHAAITDARTLFPSRVSEPVDGVALLKPGKDTRKLGHVVAKGRWREMPIYSLTLEERATCPRDCKVFNACYGNRMWMARRWKHGAELETRLEEELGALQSWFPEGFVIRLHILGDFYSVEYVELWRKWLRKFSALRVFGYTAWTDGTPIGHAVASLRNDNWARFSVRTSGAKAGARTLVVTRREDAAGAVICPAQLNQTDSCATCGLCWHSKRAVAFLVH